MERDIDIIIRKVTDELPAVVVRQHTVSHPGDDDGIWWFSLPGERSIHVESSYGICPFAIETDEQGSGEALRGSSVDQVVRLVVEYLTKVSAGLPVFLSGDRYWA